MARNDPFGQRFGKVLDRVFAGQGPEWRRLRMRTLAVFADCVAARTVVSDEHLALINETFIGGSSLSWSKNQKRNTC
jgi:hypothetical protein